MWECRTYWQPRAVSRAHSRKEGMPRLPGYFTSGEPSTLAWKQLRTDYFAWCAGGVLRQRGLQLGAGAQPQHQAVGGAPGHHAGRGAHVHVLLGPHAHHTGKLVGLARTVRLCL